VSLAAAVKQLRRSDREVLALRFRDELKQSEIADRIGVSQMQVSRILRRATDRLRETFDVKPAA
jgi:RNA polymerase sigma-B factor